MAQGAICYIYEAVKRALLVAAARPLITTTGRLDRESAAIYKRYPCSSNSGSNNLAVYGNPVFASDAFTLLVDRVKDA
jgi:hypothetical protein